MKKIIIALITLFIMFFAISTQAGDILSWDASEGAEGYKIYFLNLDINDPDMKPFIKTTTETFCNLYDLNIEAGILYRYNVTAFNKYGESLPSDSIDYTIPAFVAGEDNLPPAVIDIPGRVSTIIINIEQ